MTGKAPEKSRKTLYCGINTLLTLSGAAQKNGKASKESDLTPILNGVILQDQGRIEWVGAESEARAKGYFESSTVVDLKCQLALPSFIECHTHSLFAGDRSEEFELRQQGMSYQEISKRGGGIRSTVKATRTASDSELENLLKTRIQNFRSQGVSVVEVKSGYGLSLQEEVRLLRVIRNLNDPNVISTFMGPHSSSPEYADLDSYLNDLCDKVLPQIKAEGLSHRADIFIEGGFYTLDHARKYFAKAKSLGFDVLAHVEQLSHQGGLLETLKNEGVSVDHCVHAKEKDIEALVAADATAVLLPSSDFYMNIEYPPARQMLDRGARVALSTDFNPGTSPSQSVELVSILSRLQMKMSLFEVLIAWTVGAAHALKLEKDHGSLAVGKHCNFVTFDQPWTSLFYDMGGTKIKDLILNGKRVANS